MRKVLLPLLAVVLLLTAACSNKQVERSPVAVVNGVHIEMDDFESMVDQLKSSMMMQGIDLDTEEGKQFASQLEDQALDQLINQELLIQEVNKEGYTVAEEEVNAQVDNLKAQYGASFPEILKLNKLTEESLRQLIINDMKLERYIDKIASQMVVSNEEILSLYEMYIEYSGEELDYEEVKDQIEEGLQYEKAQEYIYELLTELRANSDVTILYSKKL